MIGLKIAATGMIVWFMLSLLDKAAQNELPGGWYSAYAVIGVISMLSVPGGLIFACWSL